MVTQTGRAVSLLPSERSPSDTLDYLARDDEREPSRRLRSEHARRQRIPVIAARHDSASAALRCPACAAAVFVPGDSHGEQVRCDGCAAELTTARDAAGVVTLHEAETHVVDVAPTGGAA